MDVEHKPEKTVERRFHFSIPQLMLIAALCALRFGAFKVCNDQKQVEVNFDLAFTSDSRYLVGLHETFPEGAWQKSRYDLHVWDMSQPNPKRRKLVRASQYVDGFRVASHSVIGKPSRFDILYSIDERTIALALETVDADKSHGVLVLWDVVNDQPIRDISLPTKLLEQYTLSQICVQAEPMLVATTVGGNANRIVQRSVIHRAIAKPSVGVAISRSSSSSLRRNLIFRSE